MGFPGGKDGPEAWEALALQQFNIATIQALTCKSLFLIAEDIAKVFSK